jgi:hypothetical protein
MDRETYRKMYKMPKPRDYKTANTIDKKEQLSLKNSKYRIDYRPRIFFKLMKVEIIILLAGLGFAISKNVYLGLTFYSRKLQHQGNSSTKAKQMNETDIQKEIQKTLKELNM